ncbi:MAG: hypothetical protein ACRDHZ_25930 [Ktedonobacteraceae bacterium]
MAPIEEKLAKLHKRHYIRNATEVSYWFDFSAKKLQGFIRRYGKNFCLVINGSHVEDDVYVIPFSVARQVFTEATMVQDHRERWMGVIQKSQMILRPTHATLQVSSYHNAFHYL